MPAVPSCHRRNQHRMWSQIATAFFFCVCYVQAGPSTSGTTESPIRLLPSIQNRKQSRNENTRAGAAARLVATAPKPSESLAKKAAPPLVEVQKRVSPLLNALRSGAASGAAAATVKTLLQPLDAIKTLQQYTQTDSSQRALSTLGAARALMNRPGGLANFYAGLGVTVVGSIPGVALYFGVYQFCKQKFLETDWGAKNKRLSIALAAAIGNSIASTSRTPYEVLKQKLQMGTYPTFGAALRAVLANPMNSLFPKGGVAVQMIRDVPYAVATLLVYESLQEALRNRSLLSDKRKKQWDFVIGGIAGGFGSWVTNPMDVIKTRLQTDTANLYGGSVSACTSMLWNEGGASVFLRGSVPRLMHKVPANCFFFLFYEMFKRILGAEPVDTTQTTATKQ